MQLQQQKQYDVALEWFRTIYDYNALVGQRVIYTPLEQQSFSANYQRAYNWLLEYSLGHQMLKPATVPGGYYSGKGFDSI